MKYITVDEFNKFEFHDAEIEWLDIQGSSMVWRVLALNATIANSQNEFDKDMCIKEAIIQFEDFNIDKIVYSAYKTFDSNNNLIESSEAKEAEPGDNHNILIGSVETYCRIHSMEILSNISNKQRACCNIDSFKENFEIYFSFARVNVQWDEFSGLAWYEDDKWKKK